MNAMIKKNATTSGPSLQQHRTHGGRLGGDVGSPPGADSRSWQGLVLWVGLTAATAVVGSLASSQADRFYAALQRPMWAPPAWLFGPVWTVLFVLMACAAVMVHRRLSARPQAVVALRWYALALLPNALWSWTFFRWHMGAASLVVIAVLWLLLVATVWSFWRVRPASAALMMPVTLWVSFASALNIALLRLNPGVL
jgi:translocator protein